ncbi:hypothetical protein Dimus_008214 [Dionaea muscipula]
MEKLSVYYFWGVVSTIWETMPSLPDASSIACFPCGTVKWLESMKRTARVDSMIQPVPALEGRDIIARAKTGTGKTLAFGIPMIKSLSEDIEGRGSSKRFGRLPKVLVLAPIRELARQVENEIKDSAPNLNIVCVYGGVSYNSQQNALLVDDINRGDDDVVGGGSCWALALSSSVAPGGE